MDNACDRLITVQGGRPTLTAGKDEESVKVRCVGLFLAKRSAVLIFERKTLTLQNPMRAPGTSENRNALRLNCLNILRIRKDELINCLLCSNSLISAL